jgi:activator of HSP90 ATPase
MPKTVRLGAELAATPAEIFDQYLNSRSHAAITGAPAVVNAKAGAKFSAFGGGLRGTILQLVPGRLIVQSWRASDWKARDIDSTLILTLLPKGRGSTLIELVHVNVPDRDFAGVSKGWEQFYWSPWREYLQQRSGGKKGKSASTRM